MQTDEKMNAEVEKRMASSDLIVAKLRWEQARAEYQKALGGLNITIADAADRGMSQSEIGRTLGWPRQRVSKLLQDLADAEAV